MTAPRKRWVTIEWLGGIPGGSGWSHGRLESARPRRRHVQSMVGRSANQTRRRQALKLLSKLPRSVAMLDLPHGFKETDQAPSPAQAQ